MKVKLRFIPLNQMSKDTVTARGIKNVLDLTLSVTKLWKTVMDHILGKWSGIEELTDRLELFLEGSLPPKSDLKSSYKDISVPVESVISSAPSFQSCKAISSAKTDEVTIIPIFYNIKEKKIAVNALMSPTKRKDTPVGYSLADESWLHAFDMFNDSSKSGRQQGSPERQQDIKSNNSSSSGCLDNPNDMDMMPQPHADSLFGQFASDGHSLTGHSLMGGGLAANNAASSSSNAVNKSSKSSIQGSGPRIFDAVKNVLAQPNAKAPSILESDILSQQQQPTESPVAAASSSSLAVEESTIAANGKRPSSTADDQENEETEKPKQSKRVRFSAEVSSPKKQTKQSMQAIRSISKGQSIPSMSVGSTQVNPETFKALFSRIGRSNPTWKRIRPTYIGPITR